MKRTLIISMFVLLFPAAFLMAYSSVGGVQESGSPTDTLSVRAFGAKGNGSTDDTTAVNQALHEGCVKHRAVYFPAGTYAVHPLHEVDNCSMTLYGDSMENSVLKLIASGGNSRIQQSLLSFSGRGTTLLLHDLGLEGQSNPISGLQVHNILKATIFRLRTRHFGTPGYRQGHKMDLNGMYFHTLHILTISNCVSQYNERDGISTQAVHYLKVSNCDLSNNGRLAGVAEEDVLSNMDGPLEVSFVGNTARSNGSGGFDIETAKGLTPVKGYIHGNTVENCGDNQWGYGWGVVLGNNSYGEISDNTVINFAKDAGPYRNAIVAGENGGTVTIIHNAAEGAGNNGIHVDMGAGRSHPTNIIDNTVRNNAQNGVFVRGAPSSIVRGNASTNNGKNGLTMINSPLSAIDGNKFSGNKAQPVFVTSR